MGHSNGLIYAPVNVLDDLGYVLGTGSGDVGTNCVAQAINPWALYKPVRNSSPSPFVRDSFALLGFGSNPPYATTVNAFVALQDGDANGWTYLKPRGASQNPKEYYRVFDFVGYDANGVISNIGYDHQAKNPFGTFLPSGTVRTFQRGGGISASNIVLAATPYPSHHIAIQDINSRVTSGTYGLNYYGLLLVPTDNSLQPRIFLNTTAIGSTRGQESPSLSATLSSSNISVGTYLGYPFFTPATFGTDGAYTATSKTSTLPQKLIPVPGAVPTTFIIAEDDMTITITAETFAHRNPDLMDVSFTFTVENNSSESKSLTYFYAKLRLPNKAYTDPIDSASGEEQIAISNVTIAAGDIYDYGLARLETVPKTVTQLWVGYRVGTKNYTKEVTLPVPITPTL